MPVVGRRRHVYEVDLRTLDGEIEWRLRCNSIEVGGGYVEEGERERALELARTLRDEHMAEVSEYRRQTETVRL